MAGQRPGRSLRLRAHEVSQDGKTLVYGRVTRSDGIEIVDHNLVTTGDTALWPCRSSSRLESALFDAPLT